MKSSIKRELRKKNILLLPTANERDSYFKLHTQPTFLKAKCRMITLEHQCAAGPYKCCHMIKIIFSDLSLTLNDFC